MKRRRPLATAEARPLLAPRTRPGHPADVPLCALIVPAFNEEIWLSRCLEALRRAAADVPGWDFVLIVVDNNSTDATPEVAARAGARVVFEAHNQIARARNAGAGAVPEADAFVFVDADSEVPAPLLQRALERLEQPDVAGGGAHLAFDASASGLARQCLAGWNALSSRMRWMAGSFIFVRGAAFRDLGGFSTRFYAGEEIDFSRRLRRWARRHRQCLEIIKDPPLLTSSRKFSWHAPWKVAVIHLALGLCPVLVTSRRWCGFWYRRPPGESVSCRPPGSEASLPPS